MEKKQYLSNGADLIFALDACGLYDQEQCDLYQYCRPSSVSSASSVLMQLTKSCSASTASSDFADENRGLAGSSDSADENRGLKRKASRESMSDDDERATSDPYM